MRKVQLNVVLSEEITGDANVGYGHTVNQFVRWCRHACFVRESEECLIGRGACNSENPMFPTNIAAMSDLDFDAANEPLTLFNVAKFQWTL